MRKVPKKARKALRRLAKMPPARKLRGHVHAIYRATDRHYPPAPTGFWRGPW